MKLPHSRTAWFMGQGLFPGTVEFHYVETARLDSHWTAGLASENVPVTVSSPSWIYHKKIEIMC